MNGGKRPRARRWARRRVWIAAAAVVALEAAAWIWFPGYRYVDGVIDPTSLPYEEGIPSEDSRHPAPFYGTRVRFEPSAPAAFARAAREGKLVLLLHLSGRFESSNTT